MNRIRTLIKKVRSEINAFKQLIVNHIAWVLEKEWERHEER